MMLDHLELPEAARDVEQAVAKALAAGKARTADLAAPAARGKSPTLCSTCCRTCGLSLLVERLQQLLELLLIRGDRLGGPGELEENVSTRTF